MSRWPATRARRVLDALLRIGWSIKRQTGSHRTLQRPGYPDYVFAFHDRDEIGPRMLARVAKHTRSDAARPLTVHAMLLLKAEACVSRRDVDEAQLHPLDAVPAVEAQGAGGVHPLTTALPERDPQFLSGRTKRDGIDDRPVA
jgi:predicted RNA binding protein YcfA (HicA-like mRNA interferase family)